MIIEVVYGSHFEVNTLTAVSNGSNDNKAALVQVITWIDMDQQPWPYTCGITKPH